MEASKQWSMAIIAVVVASIVIWGTFAYLVLPEHEEEPNTVVFGIDGSSLQTSKLVDHGSGTPSDPYVITGLEIEVKRYPGEPESYGISISDVDAHLIISGSRIHTDYSTSYRETIGIRVWNSSNVTIWDCKFENLTRAIEASHSVINVSYSWFESCEVGVQMERLEYGLAPGTQIMHNVFENTDHGVNTMGNWGPPTWSDVLIKNNSISHYQSGVAVYGGGYNFTIAGNDFHYGSGSAVAASKLSSSEITDNKVYQNVQSGGGFDLSTSSNVTILGNWISVSGPAISLHACMDVLTRDNYITGQFTGHSSTGFGILVENSISVNITYNTLWETNVGVILISSGPGNSTVWVHHNEFVGNFVQAIDNSASENYWDDGVGAGNYWDDYEGTDDDSDGVGDTPYQIDSDIADHYPLMTWPV
jgi:nitrous oxidase accessory protein NosD